LAAPSVLTIGMSKRRAIHLAAGLCACIALALPAAASAGLQTRVVGGGVAPAGAYPWQAAVMLDAAFHRTDFAGQFCGGVLVTPRIVLTAAHCVRDTDPDATHNINGDCLVPPVGDPNGCFLDPNDVDVALNESTLSPANGERHDIQAVYIHPDNNPNTYTDDVAYLVLSAPTGIPPLKLAGPSETALWTPGRATQVTGYGTTAVGGGGSGSNSLKVATVPILPDSTCSSSYGSLFFSFAMVCAGYVSEGVADSCQGDSGGPLAAPAEGGIFRLVGLVSFGEGCANADRPGVYSRLGAPGSLFQGVVDEVAAVETGQGISPHYDIVGSGALPPGTKTPTTATKKKCSKLKGKTRKATRKKRARCRKKQRKKQAQHRNVRR
jgi:secreted trypsin-like serine protease